MLLLTVLLFSPFFLIFATALECENIGNYCGGVLTEKNGSIYSPSFPEVAPPHTLCKWQILTPIFPSPSKVTLNFKYFEVSEWSDRECRLSYVKVEGETMSNEIQSFGRFCGSTPSPLTFEGSSLSIEFRTNWHKLKGSAFEAMYKIECSQFTCDDGFCISFDSVCFGEAPSFCTREGKRPVCTDEMCSLAGGFPCDGKCLFKRNVCDLEYDCEDHSDEKDCDFCGGVITESNGTITSPNYPLDYPTNARCKWIFTLKPNTILTLRFKKFRLDTPQFSNLKCRDFVAVEEIRNYSHEVSYEKYCGYNRPSPITIRNGTLVLSFKSDFKNELPTLRFKALFQIECEGLTCDDDKCISYRNVCDGHQDCDDNSDEETCEERS